MYSRLAIDCGGTTVRAVLAGPLGWTVLNLDGVAEMSTAVHVNDSEIVAGMAAWQRGAGDPNGFVMSPMRAGPGPITVAGRQVAVADLVAAILRQVLTEAVRVAGSTVDETRLVVPAGAGPQWKNVLRDAARTAGLAVTTLVAAPIAATRNPTDADTGSQGQPVGPRTILVVDVGAGCTASVVRHDPHGEELLSTRADPGGGGDRIDANLALALTGTSLDNLPAHRRWPAIAGLRTTRHALTHQPAVTMPMPDGRPPLTVTTDHVREAARPVFEQAGALAGQALTLAEVPLGQLDEVRLIGATAVTPGAADMIAAKLGTQPHPVPLPHLAAVLGAAGVDPTSTLVTPRSARMQRPPWSRLVTLAVPGVASLLLYVHFMVSADTNNGTPTRPGPFYYVLASWGELCIAAVLALIGFLQAASLFANLLDQRSALTPGPSAPTKITGGIVLAVTAGFATAGLYGLAAATLFNQPATQVLKWAMLPLIPAAIAAVIAAAIAVRRPLAPAGGWDALLTFPGTSMITAAVGILAVSQSWHSGLPGWLNGWTSTIGLAGGVLIGVAIAFTLISNIYAALGLSIILGAFTGIISRDGPDTLSVLYALAVAVWWGWHAWTLARRPTRALPN